MLNDSRLVLPCVYILDDYYINVAVRQEKSVTSLKIAS